MSAQIRQLRAASVTSSDDPMQVGASGDGWPTTLRFSRRLGEALRDVEYAITIEGPDGRPLALLEPASGLARPIARLISRLRRSSPRKPS